MMVASDKVVFGLTGAVTGAVIGSIAGAAYESYARVEYAKRLVVQLITTDAGAGHVFSVLWVMAGRDQIYGNYGPKEQEIYSFYMSNIWNEANAKANPSGWFDTAWKWIQTT